MNICFRQVSQNLMTCGGSLETLQSVRRLPDWINGEINEIFSTAPFTSLDMARGRAAKLR